ncbi:MAG TPA: DUF4382 domain-containing protein [Chitinophagaceae bacterium]|nr:DUF4382 domain-containing protein [Chitinophagaceae bacterium]
MKIKYLAFTLIASTCILLFACKKDTANSTLHIRMTDAPIALEEVNIDLMQVNVKFAKDTAWVALQTTAGIYNLLGLQNGVDTLIAQGSFPSDVVKEIRLVLGGRNSIKSDGQIYSLTIPSGSESGLKLKVSKHLQADLETLLIDFDAALSVKQETDGYKLRPVLKLK